MSAAAHHETRQLEEGYIPSHRRAEKIGIVIAVAFSGWLLWTVSRCAPLANWWTPAALLVGLLASDFTSGFVHWLFDTWGSLETPILGALAIRTFREHHVAPQAITSHDFVETNGHNIALTVIWSSAGLALIDPARATSLDVFLGKALLFATFFTGITSQIHKWAHTERPPRAVAFLQRNRLILSPEHHSHHHLAPHKRNYCITTGWLNGPLHAIRFFESMEGAVFALTGWVPREHANPNAGVARTVRNE